MLSSPVRRPTLTGFLERLEPPLEGLEATYRRHYFSDASLEDVLRRADERLYRAKQAGRNRVES